MNNKIKKFFKKIKYKISDIKIFKKNSSPEINFDSEETITINDIQIDISPDVSRTTDEYVEWVNNNKENNI